MYGACGSVSLDNYWNNIATPFLFIILGFGLFVLFGLNDIHFLGSEGVLSMAGRIGSMRSLASSNDLEEEMPAVAEDAANVGQMHQDAGKGANIAAKTNAMVQVRRNASLAAGATSNAAAVKAAANKAQANAAELKATGIMNMSQSLGK